MTPQEESVPSLQLCVCGKSQCLIPFGFCHCGCGRITTILGENDKSTGATKGVPRKYIQGHNGIRGATLPVNTCICRVINCVIPYGLCHCGCGGKTRIARTNRSARGWVRGYPVPLISRHSIADRPDISQFKCPTGTRIIALTHGKIAIVDESYHEVVSQRKWHTIGNQKRTTPNIYAGRTEIRNGKQIIVFMHREILGIEYEDETQVDHINGDGLDNRRSNLRIATPCQNAWNQGRSSRNTSGYKGVSWNKKEGKWIARITVKGHRYFLGYFATAELAYAAYCEKSRELHGEFANVG